MARGHAAPHFRLVQGEPLPESLRRIVREQIDEAIRQLARPPAEQEGAIRNSRVCCKKIRAVLRLVRKEVGIEVFKREDRCFREANRALASTTDTVTANLISGGRRLSSDLSNFYLEKLDGRVSVDIKSETGSTDEAVASVAYALTLAEGRVGDWPFSHEG